MDAYAGRNRRRNVLSQPRTQMRIIAFFAFMALVYAVLNVYISKYAFHGLAGDTLALSLPESTARDFQVLVRKNEATLDLQLSLFTFLSFCMVCLAGVLLSHRLGGPIYHLKQYLDGVMTGQVQPREIHFRKDDFFHDLAATFNRFQQHEGLLKTGQADSPEKGAPTRPA